MSGCGSTNPCVVTGPDGGLINTCTQEDAGSDVYTTDASKDGASDAATDATSDASKDGASDAAEDAPSDAPNGG